MTTTVLFQDDFSTNGSLNSAYWDFNHWEPQNNPSYLGLTQMRQSLPVAENGMARIQLDTWLDGNAFSGSEAITIGAFALPGNGGGIAFEAKLKFEGTQGGMIAVLYLPAISSGRGPRYSRMMGRAQILVDTISHFALMHNSWQHLPLRGAWRTGSLAPKAEIKNEVLPRPDTPRYGWHRGYRPGR